MTIFSKVTLQEKPSSLLYYSGLDLIYSSISTHFLNIFIYLFLDTGEGREKEERNINVWLPLTHPLWGPGLQPRHVPWLGIEPVALWFAGQHSVHWATPARVYSFLSCLAFMIAFPSHMPRLFLFLTWSHWETQLVIPDMLFSEILIFAYQWHPCNLLVDQAERH